MRLGWDEIKRRAKAFSETHADKSDERADAQLFLNDFFKIFGMSSRQIGRYERRVADVSMKQRGFIDFFWPGQLIVEMKSRGKDLAAAEKQALDYIDGVHPTERPRHVLSCDFQTWRFVDLETGASRVFPLSKLAENLECFTFIIGNEARFTVQDSVTIKAAELMGKLHDALEETGYAGHDLEQLLVRLLFCLFADDTGIFPLKDIFLQLLENDTRPDGSDTGRILNDLFDVLDTPESARQSTLQAELNEFPYVNGGLFAGRIRTPHFTARMRELLLDACRHDWSGVSPAIFGSLFQSVMDAKERRAKGAHYTTEANILKVIGPLFLDDLKAELAAIIARRTGRDKALSEFQHKLARLTFFDPACGCGNFLVIAYREIRRLELEALKAQYGDQQIDAALLSRVTVDQFYGIEYEEFPARIAEVAMWMMDHIANNEINEAFRLNYARIPLKDSAHILHADALETDWSALLPPERCSYIMGNPPFVGFVWRSETQQDQFTRLVSAYGGNSSRLDYVAAWFIKAGEYLQANHGVRVAFVSTNSICQGEQVAQLWPILFDRLHLEIAFAHRTFSWGSEARGKAHVHVVIVGLAHRDNEPAEKRLFSYPNIKGDPVESRHSALTAYLFDARGVANRHLVINRESSSLTSSPKICVGTKPVDGGHYLFDASERDKFISEEPGAAKAMHPFLGGYEFINGQSRWILHTADLSPAEVRQMPKIREKIAAVREFRTTGTGKLAKQLAETPTVYHVTVIPDAPFLVLPEVSSERRDYVPIGWVEPPTIPSNKLLVVLEAKLWDFAVLTSRAHMAWLAHVGGRLKSDYSYSTGLVYNTFPWPDASPAQREKIEALAQAVLDARAAYPTSSLADLYDPDTMPVDLRKAHTALDTAVDRLYRPAPFASDRDRVEHLFGRYEALVNPLKRLGAAKNKRVAKKAADKEATNHG